MWRIIHHYVLISNPMRCDGSRPKASMSTSEQNITLLYITLTIYTSASNSGNVSMQIKFKFLINLESIQMICKYVSRFCINNNGRICVVGACSSIWKLL